ncbi:transcription factor IIIB 50 kDa subunit-like [Acanthaster planci]|uniref:Transcription factor IIIB 50 kDa subunit-like n=1 Tax=Acanthaster planci TaxID=133434 RepID=A0A8B7YGG8_ACAPL|nr:transcription factor IIIB 50 kDa subunit-like [Acanthaster planci]
MDNICRQCGSSSIIDDDHGGQIHRVCSDCGEVINSTTCFEQEKDYWNNVTSCNQAGSLHGSNLGRWRNIRQGDPSAPSRNLKPWMSYLKEVCSMMGLSAEMEKGVVDIFSQACKGILKCKQRLKKQALCGAAVFTVCRQNDWPVVLSDVSTVVQCSVSDLFAMKKLLTSEFNIQTPNADIEDLIESVLKRYGFDDQTFVEKSVKVVSLAKDAWITCGRSHDAVIIAAAFLVWKSSEEGRGKGKQMATFCQQLPLKPPCQTAQRAREIRSILITLVKKIPWLKSKKITPEMATQYLDDVLKNKKYLISRVELPQEEDSSDVAESTRTEETVKDGLADPSNTRTKAFSSPTCMLPPFLTQVRKRKLPPEDSEENMGKHSKEQPVALSVDKSLDQGMINLDEELSERDIPESEMHLYVRSELEVAKLQSLQQALWAQESSTE